jgi:hypothetical protein
MRKGSGSNLNSRWARRSNHPVQSSTTFHHSPVGLSCAQGISVSATSRRSHEARRSAAASTCSGFRSAHSHTVDTRHPSARSAARTALSLATFPLNLACQNSGRLMEWWYTCNPHGDAKSSLAPRRRPSTWKAPGQVVRVQFLRVVESENRESATAVEEPSPALYCSP